MKALQKALRAVFRTISVGISLQDVGLSHNPSRKWPLRVDRPPQKAAKEEGIMSAPSEPLYLFGYGSLIWNPGFKPSREWCYELQGFHRSASVYSWKYRGTPESPGLVLGLEAGGTCAGILYEVAPENRESVYEEVLLRERGRRMPHEQTWMPIYDEHHFEFEIPDGTRGRALVFVCNPESPQYAGKLSQDEKAKLLAFSRGENGTSLEYFQNLLREFHRLGISDPEIENLVQMAQKLPEFK